MNLLEVTLVENRPSAPAAASELFVADLTLGPGVEFLVYGTEPLTDEEIQIFEQAEEVGGSHLRHTPNAMRHSHHEAARLVAAGHHATDITLLTGIRSATLSWLRRSPAFLELIQHYADLRAKEIVSLSEKMKVIALDGLQALHERVIEPEATPSFVLKATEAMLDRSGFAAKQKVEVNGLHTHVLARIRESHSEQVVLQRGAEPRSGLEGSEAGEGSSLGVIDVEPSPVRPGLQESGSEAGGQEV